ncbi:MAG: hypothetical protein J5J00_09180 [Deltaproteobacteria bacterium]|nr:hypothetical protein [Deltaproteobacteria bacterium]
MRSLLHPLAGILSLLLLFLSATTTHAANQDKRGQWRSAAKEASQAEKRGEEVRAKTAEYVGPKVSKMPAPKKQDTNSGTGLAITYVYPVNGNYTEIMSVLKDSGGMEEIIEAINSTFNFPRIDVVLDECGQDNAFYDPSTRRIILCYELVVALAEGFSQDEELSDDDVGTQVIASLIFTFFHELGHAAVDVFDLPITGNEEDAVDRFATLILLSSSEDDEDEETDLAHSAIGAFDLDTIESLEDLDFSDEHPVDEQRWYTMACLMVGSNPEKYDYLVGDNGLPSERAETCPAEYERISKSWQKLLEPHVK